MAIPPVFIKTELLKRGITSRAIAAKCGLSESAVSHVIAGRRRNADVEQAIADAIEMPVALVFAPRHDGRRTQHSAA